MAERTNAGLLGDLLATQAPAKRLHSGDLAVCLQRDRTGVNDAIAQLVKAGAITSEPDAKDKRRNLVYMTHRQVEAWSADQGATAAAGVNLSASATNGKAAAGAVAAKAVRQGRQGLRFGLWSDGALTIDGLARKQLTLSPEQTSELAHVLSSLPEGALQALLASALRPAFALQVDGREHPLTPAQRAELVAYIEQLPARAIRPVLPRGADHRVHRIETPEVREAANG